MKRISNEVKLGATAFITILVFIWLYNFLKGKDLFSTTNSYYSVYTQIGGLAVSSPVEINGYRVGIVRSIEFINDGSGKLVVKFSVVKDFRLPQKTVAEITTATLIAGMKIRLKFGEGPNIYHNGDTIPGVLAESVITKFSSEISPLKEKLSVMVNELDSTLNSINGLLTPDLGKNLSGTVSNLNHFSKNLDDVLGSKETDLKALLSNLSKFSKMLSDNSDQLGKTLNNLQAISDTIAAADLYTTIINLKTTLEKTSKLMEGVNKGKGTAGQLVTNDSLYINLNNGISSLDLLLKDVKANPKRYVHFSLFGKKNLVSK